MDSDNTPVFKIKLYKKELMHNSNIQQKNLETFAKITSMIKNVKNYLKKN